MNKWKIFVFVLIAIPLVTWGINNRKDNVRRADEEYLGKEIELVGPIEATFEVSKVFVTLDNAIYLYGTLIFDVPDGYEYNGAAPGSLTLNFSERDGHGGYSLLLSGYDFVPKEGWRNDKVDIRIKAIQAK